MCQPRGFNLDFVGEEVFENAGFLNQKIRRVAIFSFQMVVTYKYFLESLPFEKATKKDSLVVLGIVSGKENAKIIFELIIGKS